MHHEGAHECTRCLSPRLFPFHLHLTHGETLVKIPPFLQDPRTFPHISILHLVTLSKISMNGGNNLIPCRVAAHLFPYLLHYKYQSFSNYVLFQLERSEFLVSVSKSKRKTPNSGPFRPISTNTDRNSNFGQYANMPKCFFFNLEKTKALKQMVVLIVYISIKFSSVLCNSIL